MEATSRILFAEFAGGLETRKAMILRLSGSTMGAPRLATGPPAWTLKIGVPRRWELYTNIISL